MRLSQKSALMNRKVTDMHFLQPAETKLKSKLQLKEQFTLEENHASRDIAKQLSDNFTISQQLLL